GWGRGTPEEAADRAGEAEEAEKVEVEVEVEKASSSAATTGGGSPGGVGGMEPTGLGGCSMRRRVLRTRLAWLNRAAGGLDGTTADPVSYVQSARPFVDPNRMEISLARPGVGH
nr:hypothetical protein [Acidobacteriota bacterium]